MTRDQAIDVFTTQCVPSKAAEEAIEIWEDYRNRASALPLDRGSACARLPLNADEHAHAQKFMDFLNVYTNGQHQVSEVLKVNLRLMLAYQYQVVTERSDDYAQRNQNEAEWMNELLPTAMPPAQFSGQFSLGLPHNPHPMSSQILIELPHAECAFLPAPQNGLFGPSQFMRHVTVCAQGQKILLKAGYHRSFARLASAPPGTVPTAVVALERNSWVLPVNQPPAGVGVIAAATELHPSGRLPALFSDFSTEGLFMDVLLRRKRFQLHVQSTMIAVDDI